MTDRTTALNRVRRHVLACTWAMAVLAMATVGLMMLTIAYDAAVRYAFAAPTDWAFPLNAAGVLVSTSLALPYFYARGQHISMDLVHRALPSAARRACDAVAAAATALLGAVLAATSFRSMTVAIEGGLTGSGTFRIPLWIPDAVLALTGALLFLVALLFPPGGRTGGAPEAAAGERAGQAAAAASGASRTSGTAGDGGQAAFGAGEGIPNR